MKNLLVSVIIPTYNRANCIRRAIDSVLKQTYAPIELIIVDDGSSDGTKQMLQEIADRCILLCTKTRSGPSAARNKGIAAAHGDLIAFLDSDDLWLPEKVEAQLHFFHENPDSFVCQTQEVWIRNGLRVNPKQKHQKHSGWIFTQSLPLCIVSPSAVMLKRSVLDTVGLFDESMPACEDYDLWLRITPRYPIHLIDRPLVIKYGGHADQQSRTVAHLDRWRIYSLCKILSSGVLNPDQFRAACRELEKKCRIYGMGCFKHGRPDEGEFYLKLPNTYIRASDSTSSYEPCLVP